MRTEAYLNERTKQACISAGTVASALTSCDCTGPNDKASWLLDEYPQLREYLERVDVDVRNTLNMEDKVEAFRMGVRVDMSDDTWV